MNKSSILLVAALAAAGFSMPAAAADKPMPVEIVAESVLVDAELVAIDVPSRMIEVRLKNGDRLVVLADAGIKNIDKLKPGDQVALEYRKALAIALKKGDGKGDDVRVTKDLTMDTSLKTGTGKDTAGDMGREVDFTANVIDVQRKSGTLTVLGATGRIYKLRPNDRDLMAKVRKGDQLQGTYIEALAVALEPKPAKM